MEKKEGRKEEKKRRGKEEQEGVEFERFKRSRAPPVECLDRIFTSSRITPPIRVVERR